ncbi:hypothetical protein CAPTEDRAFT_201292 [Capitella teleta]|uniref:G-protein coupled receptors family 1 profile domain-containing protein n=1 Tax=Capitella teleta TaxID=283909 RepID=R7V120_CAPTE|nr:hypothetical protein CAPTEDRAFT_201292 [Capitella teleta]|eukprot:ELU09401.1 hypothetical protein CAPTEDRAFT_201292 [Capitella teleta]
MDHQMETLGFKSTALLTTGTNLVVNTMEALTVDPRPSEANTLIFHGNQRRMAGNGSDQSCVDFLIAVRLVFGALFVVLGFLGNGATIFVLGREKQKTATVLALLFLAMADLLTVILYGTVNWTSSYIDLTGNRILRMNFKIKISSCVMPFTQAMNLTSVLLTLVVIWQRYIGVCKPHKAKAWISLTKVKIQALSCLCLAILFYLPTFVSVCFWREEMQFQNRSTIFHALYTILYTTVLAYSLSYIIPMAAICFMTVSLIRVMAKMKFQGSKERARMEMNISLVIIVVIFVVCQSFAPARRILRWKYTNYLQSTSCGGELYYFAPFELISVLFSSSANFFVFVMCAKAFRLKVLSCVGRNKVSPEVDGVDP